MNWLHERFASMAPPLLPILLDSAIKGAALLLLTAFAALAMRRASAAARHLVWFLAVAALLFLPFFSVMLPAWHILPAWTQTIAAAPTAAPPSAPRLGAAEGFPPSSSTPSPQTPPPDFADAIPPNTQLLPPLHPPTWQPTAAASPSQSPDAPPIAPTTPQHAATHSHNWQESVLLIWLIGSLLYCLYILLGCLSLRRLARQSSPITDPAWTTALHQARQSLRFRRAVNLITHPLRGMPMTWGLWRAWILLPEDADHWTADQRRAVLLHELAHAKRCDCLTQLITQLAVALYWFNPLLWLAWKRIQTEREQACDDLVLATGQKASTYAEQLLTIAAAMPALRYPAAIAMARPGRLEQRLVAILDTRRRRRLAATTAIALCLAACTFAAIVATLRAEEPITDPSLAVVTRWANAHGWKTQAVADTNLEQGDGWRNLPFTLDPAEEADAKACAKLAVLAGSTVNGVSRFAEPSTPAKLKGILQHRPHYFYAEFLLAEWDADNGRSDEAVKLRESAYRDAPVILVQRYAFADGAPLADAPIQSLDIECNRVQHGYLDPSLLISYHNLRTDADGCIYLPVYDTVYRTDEMADPDGYSVSYPTLGWFEAKQKVAVLPPAIVTAKPGDFVSTAAPNAPPKSHIVLPGGIGVELFAVSRYPDPTNTWWRPDGSASPIYHTDPPGLSPWPADHGYRLLWRFDKPTPPGEIIQLRFSIPCDATNYFAAVPPAWVGRQTAVFLSFPTHPQKVSIQCGLGTPWKILAACDVRAQHLTGALPPGFSLNAQKDPFGIPELIATHGPTDLDFRVLAVDADNREYQATQWGTNVPKAAKPQVIESSFGFRDPASQKIVSYRFETRSYRWSEFTNIALAPTGQRPQTQPTAAATRAVTSPPAFDFAIAQSTGQAATGFGDHLIVGTIAKGAVHTRVHPIAFPDKAIHSNFSDSEQFLGVTQNKFFIGNEYGVQTLDLSTGKIEPFPGGMKNLPPMPRTDLLIRGNRRVEWGGLANPAYGQPSTRPVDLCDLCVASGAEPPQFILSQTYSEPPSNFLFPKPPTIWLDDDHLLTLRSDDRNGLVGEARYEAVVIDLKTRTSRAVGRITGWPNAMIAPRGDGGDAIVIADSNTGDQSGHSLAKTWSLNVKAALAGTGKLEERPAHWGQFTIEKTTFDYAPDAVGLQRLLYRGKTLATAPVGPGGELVASVSPDGNSALWQIRPPNYPRDWQLYFFTAGMAKPQQIASTGEFGMPIWFTADATVTSPATSAKTQPATNPAAPPALRDSWGVAHDFLRYRLITPSGPITTQQDVTAELEVENLGKKAVVLSALGRFAVGVSGWQWDETYDPTTWTAGDPKTGQDTGKPIGTIPAKGRALLICHFHEKLPLPGKYELECGFSESRPYMEEPILPLPVPLFVVEPGQKAVPDLDPTDHSPASWGPAVDHMHARLRPSDPVHDTGNIDDLALDLRNVGTRQMAYDPSLAAMELEIDDKWYHAVERAEPPPDLLPFGPGYRWDDWGNSYLQMKLGLYPTADWRDADGHSLHLPHGKHTVRVAITLPPMPGSGETPVRLLTNSVERNTSRDFGSAKPRQFPGDNPPGAPATQPRAGKIWFDIFPSTPVKSLADFGPAFVVLDPASTGDPHATGAVGLEIRSADNSRRVAEIPRMIELRQYLESGGIRLDRDQLRRVGPIADGSYLAALTTTGGARCSEVIRLVIDSKYTPPAEPTLRLEPTPLGPGEKLPAVWLVSTGPRPIDNRLTNASVMFPTLIVDGVKHDPIIPPMSMPVGPIRPGESSAAFVRLADFTPPIPPKAQYRVKAKTAGYESAEVTIPAVDSLGPAWDAATARLAPLPPAIPELRGTVIGPDGKPAAGAEIMLQGPTPSGSTAATEHCDANGRYAFVHVPVGKYMLWAEPLRIDSISIQPGKTLVQDFSSVERFKLTGRVTYQNGAPAAGKSVDVTATSNDGKVVFDASADTDAHGRYSVGTPFNNIAGVNLEGTADQGLFPDPVYGVKASAAPVNLVIPANAPGTTQPAEADRWGVLRPGLSYRLSTPHDPWPIGEKPIVWLDVKNTTSAAQHLLDGGAVALRLTGLPKDETVRLTYRTGNDVLIKPGDSVTFAITFPAKLLKPGRYPVRCAFVPNPKDAAPSKGGFRACPPLILATVAPAPPVPTSGPATQPALRDPWGRVGDFARYRLVPPAGAISTHDPVTAVLEIENIGRNPLPLAERNMGNFFADVAGWQWDETYDPTTWTAGDPKTGRDTGKPIGSVPAGGRELLFIHFNEKLPLAGKYELECGFAPAPQFEAPQSRAMPVGLFVVEPGQSAAPDVDPADHSRAAWGPAVDHMQARLYRRDPIHDGGDIDDLTIELRNVGDRQMAFDPSLGAVELEIDGKWYHAGSTSRHPARLLPFGPGIRWYDWASMYLSWSPGLDPTADWRDADGQSLRLAHGKHTVRLAITLPPMPGSGGSPVRLLTNAVERNTTRDFGSATPLPFMDANQPPNPPPAPATQPNPLPDATQPAANPALSSGPWHTRLPCGVTVELVGVSTNPSSDHSWWRPDGSPMAQPPAHAPSPTDVGTAVAPAYEFAIFVDNVPFAHETGDFQIIDKIEAHPDPFGHDGTSSVSGNWFPRPSPDLKVQPIMHLILQSFAPTEDRTTVWLGISGGPWKAIGDNVTNGKAQAESRMGINGTRIDISYAAPYEALWQANLPKNMPNREDMATFIDVAENLPADQQVRVAAILTSGKEVLSDKNPEVTDGHVHQVMARFRNVSISEIKLFRLESRPFQWTEFKDIPLRPNAATTQPSGRAFAPSAR